MITHAAGESASRRLWPLPPHTIAVVLAARDEPDIITLANYLTACHVDYEIVVESGGAYGGQIMALGLHPCERHKVSDLLSHLPLLKDKASLDNYDDQC